MMYKSSIVFQNIEDLPSFEEFLSKEVIPRFLKVANLYRIQVTSFGPSVDPTPENMKPIQFLFEIYFATPEAMQALLISEEGAELSQLVLNNPFGEAGAFICEEKFIIPNQSNPLTEW